MFFSWSCRGGYLAKDETDSGFDCLLNLTKSFNLEAITTFLAHSMALIMPNYKQLIKLQSSIGINVKYIHVYYG